jgi:diaminohydroxyphosphoribosylaminopyrimidine deaminase/5-amino-6-(5-phosphoribosylamino)uracil reductase
MERQGTAGDSLSAREEGLLLKAEVEALRASWLMTAPNPRVGALALKDGHIVGRGHHERLGGMHAEEAALRDAGAWPEDSPEPNPGHVDEIVVTLEPCSAKDPEKRRNPCVESLLAAGVERLLVGALDPDARHQGSGLMAMEEVGAQVRLSPDPSPFFAMNGAFSRSLANPDRPWILLKWAASLDGKVASPPGGPRWISGPESRDEVHEIRALSDGILIGKGTLEADDPFLNARPASGPPTEEPTRIFVGGGESLAPEAHALEKAGPRIWVLEPDGSLPSWMAENLKSGEDHVLEIPRTSDGFDLGILLSRLRKEFSLRRILVEGGPGIHGSFLREECVDAVLIYTAPILLGGRESAFPAEVAAPLALDSSSKEEACLGRDHRVAFQVVEAS